MLNLFFCCSLSTHACSLRDRTLGYTDHRPLSIQVFLWIDCILEVTFSKSAIHLLLCPFLYLTKRHFFQMVSSPRASLFPSLQLFTGTSIMMMFMIRNTFTLHLKPFSEEKGTFGTL